MKHGVIMFVSLILTLCLMGAVAAGDNTTVNYDDTQIQICEEDIQVDSIETNDLEDAPSNVNDEIENIPDCNIHEENDLNHLENANSLDKPDELSVNIEFVEINNLYDDSSNIYEETGNYSNCNINKDLGCLENINSLDKPDELSVNFEFVEINDMNTENVLNNKINSSNEYVTYNDDDLLSLPLIESDLNDDSNGVKCQENRNILFSGDDGLNTADLWNELSWVNGLSSDKSDVALIKRPLPTGFISNQTIYNNYPQNDLPPEYAMTGASGDFDNNAFIWNTSGKDAYITVDMVNESTDNILDLNLNEELNPSYQIGIDASLKALDYFKTQGIDIQKGYPYLYVLTSASYDVRINNASTDEAVNGIADVLGLELNKNIFPIHYSLWKDLVFYYLWINSTNPNYMSSYGLEYDVTLSELVESSEIKKQGDYIIYNILSYGKDYPPQINYFNGGGNSIINNFMNATNVNLTNNTSNVTNVNHNRGSNVDNIVGNSVAFKGNVNNLFYAIGAIVFITLIFSVVHSKRN